MPQLRFPYLLFDLGSTLIYFDGDWTAVMAKALQRTTQTLREMGYDLDAKAFPAAYSSLIEQYYQKKNDTFIEYTSEEVLEEALRAHSIPNPPTEHLRQALKAFYAVSQAHWHVEPDAAETLETLRARGHRLGVVSNASDDADVQTLVDQANLRSYFDFVLTSAAAGVRKPDPKIFQQALAEWGARPEQVVMIGDTVSADVVGARGLGITSVWIMRRGDTPENRAAARDTQPDATIYALTELPAVLEHWDRLNQTR